MFHLSKFSQVESGSLTLSELEHVEELIKKAWA